MKPKKDVGYLLKNSFAKKPALQLKVKSIYVDLSIDDWSKCAKAALVRNEKLSAWGRRLMLADAEVALAEYESALGSKGIKADEPVEINSADKA